MGRTMGGWDRHGCDARETRGVDACHSRARDRAFPGSHVRRVLVGGSAALALLGAALLASAPAMASEEVHHVFGRSITAQHPCEFSEPTGVAVKEASGGSEVVYVRDRASNAIDSFNSSGSCLTHHKAGIGESGEESFEGIAVDNSGGPSTGDIYVANAAEKAIIKFREEPGGALLRVATIKSFKVETEKVEFEEIHGLAVDKSGTLWVYAGTSQGEGIDQFNDASGKNEFVSFIEPTSGCSPRPGFAVAGAGEFFYVGRERENRKGECEEPTTLMKLNAAGEPGPEPSSNSQLDAANTSGVAVDVASTAVYFDNATNVSAFNAGGSFTERFGEEGAGKLGEGQGIAVDSETNDVFVADAAAGTVNVYEPAKSTPPTPETHEPPLPDHRAWELVSPPNKHGATLYPAGLNFGLIQASKEGDALAYTASAPVVENPPSNRAPEPATILSRRSEAGWSNEDIGTPRGEVPIGWQPGEGTEYRFLSADLSTALIEPDQGVEITTEKPLASTPVESTETTVYQRNLQSGTPCEPVPSPCYEAMVAAGFDGTPGGYGGKVHILSAAPDAHHAVLKAEPSLLSEAPKESLYEWSPGEALKLVSVFPAGESLPLVEGALEGSLRLGAGTPSNRGGIFRNAVSKDGSRVIWSATELSERASPTELPQGSPLQATTEGALYVYNSQTGKTTRVDSPQGVDAPVFSGATYQTASEDGSRVFFTDTSRLTPNASGREGLTSEEREQEEELAAVEGKGDLYVCEFEKADSPECKLEDLTRKADLSSEGEPAGVQGVIGASSDGTYVYFVADGALGHGGGHGNCEPRSNTELGEELRGLIPRLSCVLYVEHFDGKAWEEPKAIRALTTADQHTWEPDPGLGALAVVSSRVSPNGQFLAFMSNAPLTGFNNEDVNHAGVRDQEVFLYSYGEGLTCVSCTASGRSAGVFDGGNASVSIEGEGLLVDKSLAWEGQWLSGSLPGWTPVSAEHSDYQPRYLSDTGRLFFNSPESLVPADENAKEDVYEYEPNHVGTCESATGCIALMSSGSSTHESAFVDASESGDNVFFLTSASLVEQDKDTAFDIYDAHVCTGSSPCLNPPPTPALPCSGEECKAAITSAPALPPAPPTTLASSGNHGTLEVLSEKHSTPPKVTAKQRLAKELKVCKKLKKKRKRVSCQRRAKRRYALATKPAAKAKHARSAHR